MFYMWEKKNNTEYTMKSEQTIACDDEKKNTNTYARCNCSSFFNIYKSDSL